MTFRLSDLILEDDPFDGIRALQTYCYGSAQDRGFHKAEEALAAAIEQTNDKALRSVLEAAAIDRAGNRLMLIVGEVNEAHDEIRSGHAPNERYYSFPKDAEPHAGETPIHWQLRTGLLAKPEGVPSELADIVIRVMDWAGEHRIDLADAIREKLAFNEQRAQMHGNKRF